MSLSATQRLERGKKSLEIDERSYERGSDEVVWKVKRRDISKAPLEVITELQQRT